MRDESRLSYSFGRFRVVAREKQLLSDGKQVPLPPKALDTLLLLLENRGQLVSKEEFLKRVWNDNFIEEVVLAHSISQLRKGLEDQKGAPLFIETIPKRGYKFIAPVTVEGQDSFENLPSVMLAVLPFENLGMGAEREYLAEGLTEEVIATLGQTDPDHLGVIGRTSVMAYKGTTKSLAQIGRELNTQFLVEGSIRAEGSRFRITSRLIRVRDQVQTWSASYDSEPSSLLEFQRELSATIAQQVSSRLSADRLGGLADRQTRDREAYDLYLRGRYFWNQFSPPTTRRAIECYTRATGIDPGYALAWSGLATVWASSPINGDAPPLEVWPRSKEASRHAVAAGAGIAEVQTSLGMLKFWLDWEWAAAEKSLRKAIELDPSDSHGWRLLGIVLSHGGRHVDAQAAMRRARELDPLDPTHYAMSAQVAFNARDFAAAIGFADRARVLNPEFWVAYYQLALAHEQTGCADAAIEALRKAAPFSSGNSKVIGLRGYLLAKLGRKGEALEVLNTLMAVSRERYVPPYATALVYAGLCDRENVLAWLQRAHELHDVHLAFLGVDAKWDAFRTDGRFMAVVEQCAFMKE